VELGGARILVVGASSGIGRAVALQCAAGGAEVVVAGRRAEKLTAVVTAGRAADGPEARVHVTALTCDVRDPHQCDAVVAETVAVLGGLDCLVFATAIDPLRRLRDTDAELWTDVLATNVVGASLVTRAALPHLQASTVTGRGRAVYISASSVGRPLPGMGAYETSKAALDELTRAWRSEHPEVGFSCVAVGQTLGTDVYAQWDRDLLVELSADWAARGYTHDNGPGAMTVEECAGAVVGAITSPVDLRYVLALPAPGSTMDHTEMGGA
jgi:NAD(P)-dependent dehydrogenase (short-subunit alcohol dehydrogenase family)